jgi:hypothetical protein
MVRRTKMQWIDKNRHTLARLALALSALSVLMALIARIVGRTIVITTNSYMSFAIVVILFAIYFRLGDMADIGKK